MSTLTLALIASISTAITSVGIMLLILHRINPTDEDEEQGQATMLIDTNWIKFLDNIKSKAADVINNQGKPQQDGDHLIAVRNSDFEALKQAFTTK